jgi:hypothetical protein
MKSFLQIVEETNKKESHVVMSFGRMNPPTTGHLKLIDRVRDVAAKQGAQHKVIVSHSQDAKKNPLSGEQKLKHLKRYSPGTNFQAATREHPTILHHTSALNAMGHQHLHVVVGSDRVKEMHHLLHKYNGVKGTHGHYNYKSITVHSAGHRDPDAEGEEGMSGTKMRQHAQNKDFSSFRQGVPHHVSDEHAKELMHDVRKGMGLHESVNYGRNKAIFVTGGPGSGKDIIIRECIVGQNIVEMNFQQITSILNDKHKLAMRSMNPKMEAIRTRSPLIVNGPADDSDKIAHIKEELEELGYETMMIFVDTTDSVSKERNSQLSRMMVENVRQDRWEKAQKNVNIFAEQFSNFLTFDNTGELENKEEDISELFVQTKEFLSSSILTESTTVNRFIKLYENKVKKQLKDGNIPFMQAQAKAGKIDDVRDGDFKVNKDYIYRQYSESNFNKDADTIKKAKYGDKSLRASRVGSPDGIGQTLDTRAGGASAAAGAGLGDATYREAREYSNDDVVNFAAQPKGPTPNPLGEKKTLKKFREAIDSPGTDSGLGGTLGGASNKEDMVTPQDKYGQSGITIKKKKQEQKNVQ